jgi:hypothetical protein
LDGPGAVLLAVGSPAAVAAVLDGAERAVRVASGPMTAQTAGPAARTPAVARS